MLHDRTHPHHPAPSHDLDWEPERAARRRSGEGDAGRARVAARGGSTNEDLQQLATAFLTLKTADEVAAFLRDLCTPAEIEALSHRLQVAAPAGPGAPLRDRRRARRRARPPPSRASRSGCAAARAGTGSCSSGPGRCRPSDRVSGPVLRMALPVEGAAGRARARACCTRPASASSRTAARCYAHCQHVDLELLFARSDDIPVWTADGAVDLAIAGENQITESGRRARGAAAARVRGAAASRWPCPHESPVRDARQLAGRRVATSYPRSAGAYFQRLGVAA